MNMIILIDLDNTIYPRSAGVLKAIDRRMSRYMVERMGFASESVDEIRRGFWKEYGTTLRGLKENGGVDEIDFLAFVHDVPVEEMLSQDEALKSSLSEIPLRKFVFTNSDMPHARRVLQALGIEDSFERVFDIHFQDFISKPDPRSYGRVEDEIGAKGDEIVFVDDFVPYLAPAKRLGWLTVRVCEDMGGKTGRTRSGEDSPVDFTIPVIHNLGEALAYFQAEEDGGQGRPPHER